MSEYYNASYMFKIKRSFGGRLIIALVALSSIWSFIRWLVVASAKQAQASGPDVVLVHVRSDPDKSALNVNGEAGKGLQPDSPKIFHSNRVAVTSHKQGFWDAVLRSMAHMVALEVGLPATREREFLRAGALSMGHTDLAGAQAFAQTSQ